MSYPGKLGKDVPSEGQQMVWGPVALITGALTAMIMPPGGISGQQPLAAGAPGALFTDIYGVNITSNDATVEAVTLSDGINSVTWQVSTTPMSDNGRTPYRFRPGQPLYVSAIAVTAAKQINFAIRGVCTRT